MNETDVTKDGLRGVHPGREATVGVNTGPGRADQPAGRVRQRRKGGEAAMVPDADFHSYYGMPVINKPVWQSPDIPGYLFLGGLAGAGAVVGAAAQITGRRGIRRASKVSAAAAGGLSLFALVHDLGRRARFLNMLRTFKVTSPMSVGSWLLAGFVPAAGLAAVSDVTGFASPLGTLATAAAAALGPPVATYTAALISDTAVPAWHDGYRYMPFVFASSAASAAAGVGLLCAPLHETEPLRRLGAVAGAVELVAETAMEIRMGVPGEAFEEPKARRYNRLAKGLVGAGVGAAALGRRSRLLRATAGMCLLAGSALTRFAIFEAGMASAEDPRYTVVPQRERLNARRGPTS